MLIDRSCWLTILTVEVHHILRVKSTKRKISSSGLRRNRDDVFGLDIYYHIWCLSFSIMCDAREIHIFLHSCSSYVFACLSFGPMISTLYFFRQYSNSIVTTLIFTSYSLSTQFNSDSLQKKKKHV